MALKPMWIAAGSNVMARGGNASMAIAVIRISIARAIIAKTVSAERATCSDGSANQDETDVVVVVARVRTDVVWVRVVR